MALTDEQAWILTSVGLIRLADGYPIDRTAANMIFAGVNARLTDEEQDSWIDRLADAPALWEYARALPRPPADRVLEILRAAWSMWMRDSYASSGEAEVLAGLSELFGVGMLLSWRKTFLLEFGDLEEYLEAFGLMLDRRADAAARGHPLDDLGRAEFQAPAGPPAPHQRGVPRQYLLDPETTIDELGGALLREERGLRRRALEDIARLVRLSDHVALGRQLFLALAARMGVSEDLARELLG
ncbi:hypothetical protein [Nannocystis punicea]|uniref:Tellurite resistance protein TerB n=1 Tax=Nannocystis punicea TaxID=2995304 RepID=A0ABY7H6M5_9BACT|nr:hypothetical protein [Nannocystis poenicansa]WAS94926.1 hypothetical protein O0S08_02090 [Nannocystis poenicansa]